MIPRFPLILTLCAAIFAAAWSGWLGYIHYHGLPSVLDRAEYVLMDLRIAATAPPQPPSNVVIVAIDDETVAQAGGFPIKRDLLAKVVRSISEAGARTLALDLLLLDATDSDADRALAKAFTLLPTVLAGAGRFDHKPGRVGPVPRTASVLLPRAQFLETAQVGLVNIVTDAGGTPRHLPLVFQTASGVLPSLALQAATLHSKTQVTLTGQAAHIADLTQPLDLGWHLPLRYYGPRGTIRTISVQKLLDGLADVSDIDGRLIVIGATATAIGDRFNTPFDPIMPGVEVLASGISNLLDGTGLVRDQGIRQIDVAITISLALASIFALAFLSPALGSGLVLALLFGWIAILTVLFGQGYWFSATLPLAGVLPPTIAMVVARQVFDRRQARRLAVAQNELSRFHAPLLAKAIAENPAFLREPVAQEAAILFIDLSGYTGLSERLGPNETRNVLKAFHSLLVDVTANNSGLVLDFMGDGAMIGFGIPYPKPQDAQNALRTAFELVKATGDWIRQTGLQNDIKNIRIGLHAGTVIVSRLGHENQQQIAATGDSVNVASRLMEVGKEFGAVLTVSASLFEKVADNASQIPLPSAMEKVEIRGRKQSIKVALWRAEDFQSGTG